MMSGASRERVGERRARRRAISSPIRPSPIPQASASGSRSPNERPAGRRRRAGQSGMTGQGRAAGRRRGRGGRTARRRPRGGRSQRARRARAMAQSYGRRAAGGRRPGPRSQVGEPRRPAPTPGSRSGSSRRTVTTPAMPAAERRGRGTVTGRRRGHRRPAPEADPERRTRTRLERDLVAGQRRRTPEPTPATRVRRGRDDRHAGEVGRQLLERDAALAERRRGDELEAAPARLAGERRRRGRRSTTAPTIEGEDRAVLPGDVAAQRPDVRPGPALPNRPAMRGRRGSRRVSLARLPCGREDVRERGAARRAASRRAARRR